MISFKLKLKNCLIFMQTCSHLQKRLFSPRVFLQSKGWSVSGHWGLEILKYYWSY